MPEENRRRVKLTFGTLAPTTPTSTPSTSAPTAPTPFPVPPTYTTTCTVCAPCTPIKGHTEKVEEEEDNQLKREGVVGKKKTRNIYLWLFCFVSTSPRGEHDKEDINDTPTAVMSPIRMTVTTKENGCDRLQHHS
jgi:hypothetical protein